MEDIADTANIKSSRQPAMAEIAVIAASVLPTFLMCDARLYSFCSLSAFSRSSDSVTKAGQESSQRLLYFSDQSDDLCLVAEISVLENLHDQHYHYRQHDNDEYRQYHSFHKS